MNDVLYILVSSKAWNIVVYSIFMEMDKSKHKKILPVNSKEKQKSLLLDFT